MNVRWRGLSLSLANACSRAPGATPERSPLIEAAAAGKKAFLVNRIGDFAFTVAMFLIWCTYGTLNYHDTVQEPGVRSQESVDGSSGLSSSATDATKAIRGVRPGSCYPPTAADSGCLRLQARRETGDNAQRLTSNI